MKCRKTAIQLGRVTVLGICIALLLIPRWGPACGGSRTTICTVNPAACLKSMVLTKSVAGPVFPVPPGGTGSVAVANSLFIVCPATNNCGTTCTNVGVPVSASLTVTLNPPAVCPPGSPSLSATISTAAGTMALPSCSSTGTFNPYPTTVTVPGGTCPGKYAVVGTAKVTFSDGLTLTQTGDTVICLVPEAPGRPGVPRLDMRLLTENFPRVAPGDVHVARYQIINNDLSNSVSLVAFATSKQAAVRPQGANEAQGVFAISTPFGDDFPIAFNATTNLTNCIPLPGHPYTQQTISNALPVIPPGGTNVVTVGIRSYGQCASGSCSESTLTVQGAFSDSSPAVACASMVLSVDTTKPTQNCGALVNDCNHNGIPDALDIINRTSQDQNFNGVPDECEGTPNIPYFSSVSPANPTQGAPIQVQVAFNEVFPMSNVWANGSSLVLTQFFGSPLWYGTIPADTRPGPQTVYFLGKDQRGILSSYIALYNVQVASVRLNIGLSNQMALVSWTPPVGELQKASDLAGPWLTVPAAADPSAFPLELYPYFRVLAYAADRCPLPVFTGGTINGNDNITVGQTNQYSAIDVEASCPSYCNGKFCNLSLGRYLWQAQPDVDGYHVKIVGTNEGHSIKVKGLLHGTAVLQVFVEASCSTLGSDDCTSSGWMQYLKVINVNP